MMKPTFFIFFCILSSIALVSCRSCRDHHYLKLFVFGDSYADTGNWPNSNGGAWKEPYGITFPGKPSGRFSDGRVFTDFFASVLGTKSPITYRSWKSGEKNSTKYGMNFAYGGTGVFNTPMNLPNMTTQISFFQQLLEDEKLFTKQDLNSTIALVSVAGNDYATYIASNGTLQGLPEFTQKVISQLVLNIKRIYDLGVRRIAIIAMEPLGCLPQFTVSTSYQKCSDTENSATEFHNQLLEQSVAKLKNETTDESLFLVLDLYKAFFSALDIQENNSTEDSKFQNPLKPCCMGLTQADFCGDVDESTGAKKYTLCENPEDSFFWDIMHPSQEGWFVVSSYLRSTIQLLKLEDSGFML